MKYLVQKHCVHVRIDLCQNTNTLYRIPNLKNLFSQNQLSPDILNIIAISQERNVWFQKCLHQNWTEKIAIYEIAKSKFLSSETTGPFRCVESHILSRHLLHQLSTPLFPFFTLFTSFFLLLLSFFSFGSINFTSRSRNQLFLKISMQDREQDFWQGLCNWADVLVF